MLAVVRGTSDFDILIECGSLACSWLWILEGKSLELCRITCAATLVKPLKVQCATGVQAIHFFYAHSCPAYRAISDSC